MGVSGRHLDTELVINLTSMQNYNAEMGFLFIPGIILLDSDSLFHMNHNNQPSAVASLFLESVIDQSHGGWETIIGD